MLTVLATAAVEKVDPTHHAEEIVIECCTWRRGSPGLTSKRTRPSEIVLN